MSYKIVRSGKGWKVVERSGGKHPGKAFSKKPQSRSGAVAQLRAIEANSKGE